MGLAWASSSRATWRARSAANSRTNRAIRAPPSICGCRWHDLSEPGSVVFVDDDVVVRDATAQSFELAGLAVRPFERAADALAVIDKDFNGAIVSDIRMPEIDGLQFFRRVHEIDPTIPFILITGHGDIPMAVAALRDGVDDFIPKPFASAHLIASVQRGLARRRLELDNRILRSMVDQAARAQSPLVGETPAMVRLRDAIGQVAASNFDVAIEGEAGVGKELVALMLHRASKRRNQPFVVVASRALSPATAARQLFGDAGLAHGLHRHVGQIEQAHRGTLYVEDIDCLDGIVQQRLLGVIENREFTPEGAERPMLADARVIVGTRVNLESLVRKGSLRDDLYHAVNASSLYIPPVRERRGDIPLLFAHFVDEAASQLRRRPAPMTGMVRRYLMDHDWPGNVRELKSFAYRSALGLSDGENAIEEPPFVSLPERIDHFEAAAIRTILEETNGKVANAIVRLGIPRKTFYDKVHRYSIDIGQYRK